MKKISALVFLAALSFGSAHAACPILTPADVQKIANVTVKDIPFNSKPGAGGHCANYVGGNGRLYLGVSQIASAAEYKDQVASVPTAVYPKRIALKGVGDEAVLMEDTSGFLRYLVARKGSHGVILFPFGVQPSDQALESLAALAVTR